MAHASAGPLDSRCFLAGFGATAAIPRRPE
jgi:hypothetical protein